MSVGRRRPTADTAGRPRFCYVQFPTVIPADVEGLASNGITDDGASVVRRPERDDHACPAVDLACGVHESVRLPRDNARRSVGEQRLNDRGQLLRVERLPREPLCRRSRKRLVVSGRGESTHVFFAVLRRAPERAERVRHVHAVNGNLVVTADLLGVSHRLLLSVAGDPAVG